MGEKDKTNIIETVVIADQLNKKETPTKLNKQKAKLLQTWVEMALGETHSHDGKVINLPSYLLQQDTSVVEPNSEHAFKVLNRPLGEPGKDL